MPGLNEYQLAQFLQERDPQVLEVMDKFKVPVNVARAYLQAKNPAPVSVQAPYAQVPGEGGYQVNAQYAPIADPAIKVVAPRAAVPGDNIVIRAHRAPEVDPEVDPQHPLAPLANLFYKPGYKQVSNESGYISPKIAPGFQESVPRDPLPFMSEDDPEVFEAKKDLGGILGMYMLGKTDKDYKELQRSRKKK